MTQIDDYIIYFLTFCLIFIIIYLKVRKTTHTTGDIKMSQAQKAVNYSAEQVEHMVEAYTSAESDAERKDAVQRLAEELGKKVRSVTAKLVREGVYVKPQAVTKSGTKIETKAQIVADIAQKLELDAETLESLSNATKQALTSLRGAV